MSKKFFGVFSIFLFSILHAQDVYSELRKKYWQYEGNDPQAFNYLNLAISTAKGEKNYAELFQAYDDATHFSSDKKLLYADSAMAAARMSKDEDLLGYSILGKGTIYYGSRKFQLALDQYLTAYHYTKKAKDPFIKFENLYHIGVVKSYLGYYQEALPIFKECYNYFEPNTRAKIHPNLIKNNTKGYLNTIHQMIVCYQAVGKYKEADRLINEGFMKTPKDQFYYLEKTYFEKSEGVSHFHQKRYKDAITNFQNSLVGLKKINDFTWVSVAYFYKGQCYQNLGKVGLALENYKKVDSIFNKHQFILPEIRKNYEELINYYKKQNDPKEELYYTKQLLKADRYIANDFKYLSTRIHKDYGTKVLLEAKTSLEHSNSYVRFLLVSSAIIIFVLGYFLYQRSKCKMKIQKNYDELIQKMTSEPTAEEKNEKVSPKRDSKLDPKLIRELQKQFLEFEKTKGFLAKGITAGKMAVQFGTNTSYLSQFINETTGNNFNAYINQLRIKYATQKMLEGKWRKYSVEDIAESSGFSNRQSFSNIFYELNGIRPQDFLKKTNEKTALRIVSQFSVSSHTTEKEINYL